MRGTLGSQQLSTNDWRRGDWVRHTWHGGGACGCMNSHPWTKTTGNALRSFLGHPRGLHQKGVIVSPVVIDLPPLFFFADSDEYMDLHLL